MKKIKYILTTGAFAVALVLSFAFKPTATKFSSAFIKNAGGACIVPVTCTGTTKLCLVMSQQAYTTTSCTIPAFKD